MSVWVCVNSAGFITGGSVDSKRFLQPTPRGSRLILVDGPVKIGAHISAPMVWPPEVKAEEFELLPPSSDAGATERR